MIQTTIAIRRSSGLWGGVSSETVKRYREELEELKERLDAFSFIYEHNLFGGEVLKALRDEIEGEIKYCLFYEEFKLRLSEPTFSEWVFTMKPKGEQWTKTNGRIKAIIELDRTGIMVKVTLRYENDSRNLIFYEENRYTKSPYWHLKSDASIMAKVQELRKEANAFLNEHLNPLYSQYEAKLLRELLHLEGNNG